MPAGSQDPAAQAPWEMCTQPQSLATGNLAAGLLGLPDTARGDASPGLLAHLSAGGKPQEEARLPADRHTRSSPGHTRHSPVHVGAKAHSAPGHDSCTAAAAAGTTDTRAPSPAAGAPAVAPPAHITGAASEVHPEGSPLAGSSRQLPPARQSGPSYPPAVGCLSPSTAAAFTPLQHAPAGAPFTVEHRPDADVAMHDGPAHRQPPMGHQDMHQNAAAVPDAPSAVAPPHAPPDALQPRVTACSAEEPLLPPAMSGDQQRQQRQHGLAPNSGRADSWAVQPHQPAVASHMEPGDPSASA